MEEVIEYLQMKNHYYEKFYSLTAKFLAQVQKNNWDDISFFVDNRERLLNIIRSFDYKISRVFDESQLSEGALVKLRPQVKALLDKRAELASKIVNIDLELISKIDEYKSDAIRDLKKSVETKSQVDSFNPKNRRTTRVKDI
jgi:hypothetical protein